VTAGAASTTRNIVPFQWGTAASAAKMTKVTGQPNIYTYDLTPNSFFANPNNLTIYRLGLVFRNADGTKEGKTSSNTDFFVDLAQGFDVKFTAPQASGSISFEVGDQYTFKVAATEAANISLELDGLKVAEANNALELTYNYTATKAGNSKLTAKAVKGTTQDTQTLDIVVFAPSEVAALPAGAKLGINYLSTTEVLLALQAPDKSIAHVIGDFNDWKVLPEYQLKKTPDGKIFWIKLTGLVPQKEYIFQYLVDGDIRIGDPYADKVSDPFNDQEIFQNQNGPNAIENQKKALEEAKTILQDLSKFPVTVIIDAPKPILAAPPFRCSDWFNRMNPAGVKGLSISREELQTRRAPVMASLKILQVKFPGLVVWDPFNTLCSGPTFHAFDGNLPILFDGDHLSGHGNRMLYPEFEALLISLWAL
jgi:hypothetical protein